MQGCRPRGHAAQQLLSSAAAGPVLQSAVCVDVKDRADVTTANKSASWNVGQVVFSCLKQLDHSRPVAGSTGATAGREAFQDRVKCRACEV